MASNVPVVEAIKRTRALAVVRAMPATMSWALFMVLRLA